MREGLIRLSTGAALWHWDTGGEGPAVVLLHPHSGNHRSWAAQTPAFVAAGYRVVGYSRRGYFGSERGPAADAGSAAHDLAALMDALGIARASLVGSAAGGGVALDFLLAYPERVGRAVVASSFLGVVEPDFKAALARISGPWFEALPIEAKELGASFRAMDPDGVARWLEIHELNGAEGGIRQKPASRIDWPALARNRVPVLLATGGADLFMPPAVLRAFGPRIAAAEIEIVPDVGHAIFAEAPEAFNRLVLGFLARR